MSTKIPAKDAIIVWNDEMDVARNPEGAGSRVVELRVFDHGKMPRSAWRLSASRGACDSDWLQGNWITTPIGVFLKIAVVSGFLTDDVKVQALREFAKIEGEEWPAECLRDLGAEIDPDDEYEA